MYLARDLTERPLGRLAMWQAIEGGLMGPVAASDRRSMEQALRDRRALFAGKPLELIEAPELPAEPVWDILGPPSARFELLVPLGWLVAMRLLKRGVPAASAQTPGRSSLVWRGAFTLAGAAGGVGAVALHRWRQRRWRQSRAWYALAVLEHEEWAWRERARSELGRGRCPAAFLRALEIDPRVP